MNQNNTNPALRAMLDADADVFPLTLIESNEPKISGPVESEYILHPGQIHVGMFVTCYEGPSDDRSFQGVPYQVEAVQYPFIVVSSTKDTYIHTWDVRHYTPMLLKEDMVEAMLKEKATKEIIERQRIFVQRHLGGKGASSRYDLAKLQSNEHLFGET